MVLTAAVELEMKFSRREYGPAAVLLSKQHDAQRGDQAKREGKHKSMIDCDCDA